MGKNMLNVLQNRIHLHFLVQNLGIAMDYMCALHRRAAFWVVLLAWPNLMSCDWFEEKDTHIPRVAGFYSSNKRTKCMAIFLGILWKQYEEVQIFQLNHFVKSPSSFPFQGVKQFRQNDCLDRSNMLTLEQYSQT